MRGLDRVARLEAVVVADVGAGRPDSVGVLGQRRGFVGDSGAEQPGTEGARLDDQRPDAETGDLVGRVSVNPSSAYLVAQ